MERTLNARELILIRFFRRLNDGRGVLASTGAGILSRAAGGLTTLIAMPVALHHLGPERFGAFLVLFGVINWINLGNFGVQSALGRAIASQTIDEEEISDMLGAALTYAVVTTIGLGSVVFVGFVVWLRTTGTRVGVPVHETFVAGSAMIAISGIAIVLEVFEGVQIGTLRIYITNICRLCGSLFSFVALLVLPRFWSSMVIFVIALNGGILIAEILNAVVVVRKRVPRWRNLQRDLTRLRHLAGSGLAFAVIGAASLLETQVPVVILATLRGPAAAIDFGLLIRLLFIMLTGLSMLTAPLWPALSNARAAADDAWFHRSLRLAGLFVIGVGLLAFAIIAPFGRQIIHLWTGRYLVEPTLFQVLFALYFAQIAWSHYWCIVLIGLGRERLASLVFLVEGTLMAVIGGILTHSYGAVGMIGGLVISVCSVSLWYLPYAAVTELRKHGGSLSTGTPELQENQEAQLRHVEGVTGS